ncbi:ribonucleotide reductase subunit A [Synechococcus phage S-RIM2]|jgi:ribonucleoside-diphosphate reductase alpha chain|uniref:Ribonucleoside-diphosphate reductase n=5 Tax=Nerrivikvirus srim2 TaxID=2734125 RepID=A0A1D7R937_9CAUD|nr:ribonucleotide reductase large subunit [Synechococcus phage S-RIM2 R1_1999]AGH06863.1 ribonucleotide reductase subunit A [Synechococcus phage S-RIM2 R21_2007]AGH07073.1 ribonucleotide reductase subunit A [Synechococcus phage S-RIM2 R9_2006]AON97697.1 ribonucleotide reductase subunit A [Synechococcus phage S-RIM2]AGH07283.1 ribonucleotide reductase subunit A [Synechococcus phage S-RIM2 R1_1999]AON97911.1 ribonucleotide reductase subunit A [Synechococcus phage S-RIM2]
MEKGMKEIHVVKRDGQSETLDLDKIHVMVEHACNGLAGVSESQVEMNAGLQFFDGIKTADIQEILVRSANDLISLEAPNYQFVAARLLLFGLRKAVYNGHPDGHPPLKEHVEKCVERGVYDSTILGRYTDEEWEKLSSFMDHERDYLFTYAGIRQVVDKYLVQDRSSGEVYETPQFMYMMIAATLFQDDDKFYRLEYVKKYYDAISKHRINIPTPVMAGVRTPLRQFASCVLVDVDDTLDSIFSSDMAIGYYVAQRAGIGINAGRIRGINSKIRDGEVQHTGVVPFLKKFESTVRCCTQNGIRGGSATVHFPIWHQEIEDIIVLKNNKGTEDNRVRKLDYSIQISKLFYERFIQNGIISLFSPHDVPGLYDAFGTDSFDSLYVDYESDKSVPRKTIRAQELILDILKERAETGRLYIMNIDHCNSHSSFKDKVNMSNLCQEITLPTDPIQHIDKSGEIALCILSAINVGKLKNLDELDELCDLAVRGLDALIDYQEYPVKAAEQSTINRRSLGVGYIGLAHYLAKNGANYDSTKAHDLVHKLTERFQYALLTASNRLAMEKGPCGYFGKTKYADGILPIDTYKKEVDEIVPNELQCDWEYLRERIKQYGLRNSTLSAQMPSESSSVVSNATNGIEPPRAYLSIKKSKKGPLKQIVPSYSTLKSAYTLLWDMPNNDGYIKVTAVIQKFFDQAISGNWSYNPEMYPDNEVPVSVMAKDFLNTYKYGWKTSYYQNTYDEKKDGDDEPVKENVDELINQLLESEEEDCESCKI